jgi:hypothetical protein
LSKVSRAALELSARVTFSTSATPLGTANKVIPSLVPAAPDVRAAVTIMSAESPCTTNCLRPFRRKAVALPLRLERRLFGRVPRTLVDRDREDRFAGENSREPPLRVLGALDGARRHRRGGKERRGRQVPADLFEHQRGFRRAEAHSALAFRDADTG